MGVTHLFKTNGGQFSYLTLRISYVIIVNMRAKLYD